MKHILLNVPDMQSEHCQLRVKKALEQVDASFKPIVKHGQVEIPADQVDKLSQIRQAIESAGYTVSVSPLYEPANATDETYRFKTNINCSGCVTSVKPHLDIAAGINNWEVDTTNPQKVLTVHSTGITAAEVVSAVEKAGFKIEPIKTNEL